MVGCCCQAGWKSGWELVECDTLLDGCVWWSWKMKVSVGSGGQIRWSVGGVCRLVPVLRW